MRLRPARPADAPALAAIRNAIAKARGTPTLSRGRPVVVDAEFIRSHYIDHPARVAVTVAEEEGTVLGFQSLKRAWPDNPYGVTPGWGLIGTHLAPEAQGRGLGRALFSVTLAAAEQAGLPAIDATIGTGNAAGLGYYRALGFRPYGEADDPLHHRLDVAPLALDPAAIILRPATEADARGLCDLLNPIIAAGGTTAHRRVFDAERMIHHYIAPPLSISCTLAESKGRILGFQALEWSDPDWPGEDRLPADWAIIATFVRLGLTGAGIGSRLFGITRAAARAAGVAAIDATIRRENAGGRAYYSRMGFEDWRADAERISKRLTP